MRRVRSALRLPQFCQLSLRLGGDPGCVLAASLCLAPSRLFAPDLGLHACDQLTPSVSLEARSQLELLDGLPQDCKFSLRLAGGLDSVVALGLCLTPGGQLAQSLGLEPSDRLTLCFDFVACTLFTHSGRFLQCRQLSLCLGGAAGRLRAIGLTRGLLVQGLSLQPRDRLALRFDFAAFGELGLLQRLSQRGQLASRLGGAPDCRLTLSFDLPPFRIFL